MSHTPSPWIAEFDEVEDGDAIVTTASGMLTIAAVHDHSATSTEHDPDEVRANALLIAAAPELLAALHAWSEWMTNKDVPFELSSATRRALAKATKG